MSGIGLRGRILLALFVPLALFAPLTVTVVYRATRGAITEQTDARGQVLARQLASLVVDELLTGERAAAERRMTDVISSEPDVAYAFAIGPEQVVLAHTFPGGFPADLAKVDRVPRQPDRRVRVQLGDREVHDLSAPVLGGVVGNIHVGISDDRASSSATSILVRLSLIGLGVVVFGLAVTLALSSGLLRRMARLAGAADAIGEGDLGVRVGDPERDEIGRIGGAFDRMSERLALARDERERTLQHLGHSEKLVAVGRLAAGVAHEINNPLTGVVHCLDALVQSDDDSDRRRTYYSLIRDGIGRAQRVVRQLLEYSRQRDLEMESVELGLLVSRVLALVAPTLDKANVRVVVASKPDLPELRADAHGIEQVLLNLVLNALDSMPRGGELRVGVERAGNELRVRVADTGSGIDPEALGRIFDPFFTSKAGGGGSGLGLSVSLGIVERHGGRIEVSSELGQGTTMDVFLPIAPPPEARVPEVAA